MWWCLSDVFVRRVRAAIFVSSRACFDIGVCLWRLVECVSVFVLCVC